MTDRKTTWKVLCDKCGYRYEQISFMPPDICGECGADDILVGRKRKQVVVIEENPVFH